MHEYKKHLKADGSFDIKEYRAGDKERIVGDDNSGYLAFIEDGNTPEEVSYTAPDLEAEALSRRYFSKQEIRRAMRAMNIEAQLDTLLDSSDVFRKDWLDAIAIDMEDDITLFALESAELDVDAIKLQIGGLND